MQVCVCVRVCDEVCARERESACVVRNKEKGAGCFERERERERVEPERLFESVDWLYSWTRVAADEILTNFRPKSD